MKRLKQNKGITLIALIITIVIMLILAVVTIMAVNGDGIISKAKQAKIEYQNAQTEEQGVLDKYLAEMENLAENNSIGENNSIPEAPKTWIENEDGTVTDGSTIYAIGDYIEYTLTPVTLTSDSEVIKNLQTYSGYTDTSNGVNTETTIYQDTNLKWRVLDVKDGKLRIISDRPTTSLVGLGYGDGYNNAVYLLDEVCRELYSSDKGTAQNLKVEDIQEKLNWDYTTYSNYGATYEMKREYPAIYGEELNGTIGESEQINLIQGITSVSETCTMKNAYWDEKCTEEEFKNKIYNNIFIQNTDGNYYSGYWLSSRCVKCEVYQGANQRTFRVRYVEDGYIGAQNLLFIGSGIPQPSKEYTEAIRPVVTLN